MVARSFSEPSAHLGMLVGGIVVNDEMNVELGRRLVVNDPQEGEKLLMAMTLAAFADHLAGGHIEGGEQRRGSVTHIVMGVAFDIAQSHRQRGLRTIERLYLALLIHTQHHRVVRRIEVKTGHITNLLDEERVAGQLKGVAQMRLDPEQGKPALHGALRHALGLRHQAHAQSAGVVGLVLQGAVDELRHLVIIIGARPSRAKLVMQSLNASLQEPAPPFAYRRGRDVQALGNGRIGQSLRTGQNDAGPLYQAVGHRGGWERAVICSR